MHEALLVSCCLAAGRASRPWNRARDALGKRFVHQGHVRKTLEKLNLPKHHWLKEVDQAPEKSVIRRQKDKYLRETGLIHREIQSLFDDVERQAIVKVSQEDLKKQKDVSQRREDSNEALRIYRLLRPDAPPFYEEDAMLGMQAKMNKIVLEEAGGKTVAPSRVGGDPFKAYLPVVNQRAFLLALESVVASLAEDVETFWLLLGLDLENLPHPEDPLRLKLLMDGVFNAFPLMKDGSNLDEFMERSWPLLKQLVPTEVSEIEPQLVRAWLQGHLYRVRENQRLHDRKINLHKPERFLSDRPLYSFAEDFIYDNDPMPGNVADERNLDFPLEKAAAYMRSFLGAMGESGMAAEVAESSPGLLEDSEEVASQFQEFVWDLEKIGLRNWLKMDLRDLEMYIPKGQLAQLRVHTKDTPVLDGVIPLQEDDKEVAKLMLRCAARGRADLLDFKAVDPFKLLHDLPAEDIEEEMKELRPNAYLDDVELNELVDQHFKRLMPRSIAGGTARHSGDSKSYSEWLNQGATIDELYRKELDFYRTAGPVEWLHDKDKGYTWKWKQPPNTFWDEKRQVYVQEQKGVDPTLNLKEMRQHMLEVRRMGVMAGVGRVYYYRSIVLVGNGRGIYGFGTGFGPTAKDARADAAVKALQNLDYIDMDFGRMLCTPTKGMEYKHTALIIPRPVGRGLKMNKKHLPIGYLLGIENARIKFMFSKVFTRVKALKRALDAIISRRTLANMTGKRYAALVAPGDHWVHWPDRWFQEIRKPYDAKSAAVKLARRHALHFKKRSGVFTAVPQEVKPGWRKDTWARWNHPLEKWIQFERGRTAKDKDPPPSDQKTKDVSTRASAP